MDKKIPIALLLCIFLAFLFTQGCAKPKAPTGRVVARVNNDPIYASDLKRKLALKVKSDPLFKITPYTLENEIDNIINKRLLVQEAQKLELDGTERFINTIKAFWEQTLIRDLVNAKDKEFEDKITVTESEIKDYYRKLGQKATFKIIRRKDKSQLEKLLSIEKDLIAWEEVIGPVGYEEINSSVLQGAFELPAGEAKTFKDKEDYYLVYVSEKQAASAPPLQEVHTAIERQIKQKKQNQAIGQWLKGVRKKAEIEINEEYLNTLAEEK